MKWRHQEEAKRKKEEEEKKRKETEHEKEKQTTESQTDASNTDTKQCPDVDIERHSDTGSAPVSGVGRLGELGDGEYSSDEESELRIDTQEEYDSDEEGMDEDRTVEVAIIPTD